MYFPFLRAKQFDLIALRETLEFAKNPNVIVPIIEPVRENNFSSTERTVVSYCEKGNDAILITNPSVGYYSESPDEIHDVIKNSSLTEVGCVFAFMLTDLKWLKEFVEFGNTYRTKHKALVLNGFFEEPDPILEALEKINGGIKYNIFIGESFSRKFRRRFSEYNNITVIDEFEKEEKNSRYREKDLFSELPWTYREQGFRGYGDFSIVGDGYSESGGPAYAVAIHITYVKDEQIIVRHFVSDSNDTTFNPAGKFFEALKKLCTHVESSGEIPRTTAIEEFFSLYRKKHFPGLGYIKKLCILHHNELNYNLITAG